MGGVGVGGTGGGVGGTGSGAGGIGSGTGFGGTGSGPVPDGVLYANAKGSIMPVVFPNTPFANPEVGFGFQCWTRRVADRWQREQQHNERGL
ncbi:hypothetical protein C7T36_20900 [Rhodococcus sp. AD45-ID]|nr:hypothetical protein C7T36_20900 [Rhodococcus sp. AD45-ID]